jgi:hypothetical protein
MARRLKNPIKAVMAIPELWHSIQMRALHAELLDRQLLANAERFEKESHEWYMHKVYMHPGRYMCRALRPVMKNIESIDLERRLGVYGVPSNSCCVLSHLLPCRFYLLYDKKEELVDAVRTNGLHKAPSRLNIQQLVHFLMTATQ